MKFNVTIDKRTEAVIDGELCINCGQCREICPTGAVDEYQKTAFCMEKSVKMACSKGCPLEIVPQTVAALISKGELKKAAEYIREKNPMPGICATVCDEFCKETCKRSVFGDEPLNMRALERYVLSEEASVPLRYPKKYNEMIAVIGGGPAGLAAAYRLGKIGYNVTVFEKDKTLGGAMNWGIPAFRFDKDMMRHEIDRIVSAGIDVRCGWHIGKGHSLDELWQEGYRACLIAVGDSYGIMPEVRGGDADGVYEGVTVMRQITGGFDEGVEIGDKIVIVGGDGFAADLARVLVRMDKDIVMVAAEAEDELAMADDMVQVLEDERIDFRTETSLEEIIAEDGKVKAVTLKKGSELNYFCDTVIFAAGRRSIVEDICNAETYPDGKVKINDEYKTNKEMIFACGDATGETGSVVEAVAAGMEAATQIHRAVSGSADISREHVIHDAPDALAIYPEHIRYIKPQYEEKIIVPVIDEEDPFVDEDAREVVYQEQEPAEDILAVLRAAGIEEDMPRFIFDGDAYKVAVIGGGIAGITAAISLARKGYKPTIFEKEPELGGSYRWLSTEKRIDKTVLKHELDKIEACGIEVVCNASGGIRPSINQLMKAGYDAALFAIGDHGGKKYKIDGAGYAGVYDMAEIMGKLTANEKMEFLGERILVCGGDEMTFDLARNLVGEGVETTVLAPYSRGSLQNKTGAVDAAIGEGVNLVTGVKVISVEAKDGKAYNAVCRVIDKGHTISVPCDSLIIGGGGPDTETIAIRNLKLDMDESGYIAVDHKLATNIKGVFAIGDIDMSSADAGRAGAAAVDNFLAVKSDYISLGSDDTAPMPTDYEVIEGRKPEVIKGLENGTEPFTDEQSLIEAGRCMNCGYHKPIKDMCMGCGICAKLCPANAIEMVPAAEGQRLDVGKEA